MFLGASSNDNGILDEIGSSELTTLPAAARQYYNSGYNGYPSGAAGGYGSNVGPPAAFNGLDAALSALAFLAFAVWLFNLILPQLNGFADGGLGGLSLAGLTGRQEEILLRGPLPLEKRTNDG